VEDAILATAEDKTPDGNTPEGKTSEDKSTDVTTSRVSDAAVLPATTVPPPLPEVPGLPASPPSVPALRPVAPEAASRRRWWLWGAGALALLSGAGLVYVTFFAATPPTVAVEVAALAPVTRVLAVNGRIAARHAVDVRSVMTGAVTELGVAEGDLVTEGQPLAQVDAAAQDALVRQAVAGLGAARVTRQSATETYERNRALGGNIAVKTLETSAHDVEVAAQDVARQLAVLDQARAVLDSYTIRAPVAGQVITLDAEHGQIVGPTIPLLTLADPADLLVEADVDEAYATQIALNQPAVLQLTGETGTRAGRVSFVSPRVDIDTGGLAVKIAFDTALTAPIGLTVATNIVVEARAAALTVPRTALRTDGTAQGAFVVTEGVAHFAPLSVVDWPAARLIVTAGLAEGDVVITDAAGLADGQTVLVEQP
jgi:RND family efflux transporter MFP subunit